MEPTKQIMPMPIHCESVFLKKFPALDFTTFDSARETILKSKQRHPIFPTQRPAPTSFLFPMKTEFEDIAPFIVERLPLDEGIAFRPSPRAQQRFDELCQAIKSGHATPDERAEVG